MERLKSKTALIVDSSEINRIALRDLLQGDLTLVEAESVDAAIALFEESDATFDIVIQDIIFPRKSGFELLEYLNQKHYLNDIPVMVISSDNSDSFVERSFELGAIDYIRRPFAGRLLVRRVLTTLATYQSKKDLVNKIDERYSMEEPEIDSLTGLYTKKAFFDRASSFLLETGDRELCMVSIDIDHFRLYNQFFGRESGDRYLRYVAAILRNFANKYGGVVGYVGADSYYFLCPNDDGLFEEVERKIRMELRNRNLEIGFAPKIGVYDIDDNGKSVLDMCDCANTALSYVQRDYSALVAHYEPSMEQKNDDFKLIREVEYGLRNHEFTFFLQPKVNIKTGQVVGSEALVRWIQRDGTVINPGTFVPALERNGFISKVDSTVWEEVCRWQRFCIDMNYPILPVSINISRFDFYNMDVCKVLANLLEQYELPINSLELEITESAYVEDSSAFREDISRLKAMGFSILMDDFGSGYSSLNSLKEVDIDILKIDMQFLSFDYTNMSKGMSILESILNMAHSMKVPVIVEGVETSEQVAFLESLKVTFAQGYYYHKPMDKTAFEVLLTDPNMVDPDGVTLAMAEPVPLLDLSEEKMFTDEMLNNILGAIAFYEVQDDVIRLLRLNEQYYRIMGMADVMADPEYAIHLRKSIYPDDRDVFYNLFGKADDNPLRGATADIRYIKKNGEMRWIRVRVFAMHHEEGTRHQYYASLEDVTEVREAISDGSRQ